MTMTPTLLETGPAYRGWTKGALSVEAHLTDRVQDAAPAECRQTWRLDVDGARVAAFHQVGIDYFELEEEDEDYAGLAAYGVDFDAVYAETADELFAALLDALTPPTPDPDLTPAPSDVDASGWPLCGHVIALNGCAACAAAPETRAQLDARRAAGPQPRQATEWPHPAGASPDCARAHDRPCLDWAPCGACAEWYDAQPVVPTA